MEWAGAHQIIRTSERRSLEQAHSLALAGTNFTSHVTFTALSNGEQALLTIFGFVPGGNPVGVNDYIILEGPSVFQLYQVISTRTVIYSSVLLHLVVNLSIRIAAGHLCLSGIGHWS